MRPETKLKVSRRKKTVTLLRWLYSRRDGKFDGLRLSLEHRESQRGGVANTKPLTYGEVDVQDFLAILEIVKPREGEVFVDLGSGTGKAVLAAACGFPEFSKCRGIELVPSLAAAAVDHLQTARTVLGNPAVAAINTEGKNDCSARVTPSAIMTDHSKKAGRGGLRGGVVKKGRGGGSAKAATVGLNALELEAVIEGLLRQPLPLSESPQQVGRPQWGGYELYKTGPAENSLRSATTEEIASWLVRELGHRRYKASLKGYGGLQKYLVARRAARCGSSPLVIAEDGTTVAVTAPPDNSSATAADSKSPHQKDVSGDRTESSDHRPGSCQEGGSHVPSVVAAPASPADEEAPLPSNSVTISASTVTRSSSPRPPRYSTRIGGDPASVTEGIPITDHPPEVRDGLTRDQSGDACCDGADILRDGVLERNRLQDLRPLTRETLGAVEFVVGDIFREPWDNAGVVYVASLLFDDGMMMRLSEAAERLRTGARVVSLRPIPAGGGGRIGGVCRSDAAVKSEDASGCPDDGGSDSAESITESPPVGALRLVHEGVFRMSWQMARVYIYVRS